MITLLTLQLTIFLLVAVGFLMKKIHIIGPQGQKNINDLVIYLILPCNILHAFTQSAADGRLMNYLAILFILVGKCQILFHSGSFLTQHSGEKSQFF